MGLIEAMSTIYLFIYSYIFLVQFIGKPGVTENFIDDDCSDKYSKSGPQTVETVASRKYDNI